MHVYYSSVLRYRNPKEFYVAGIYLLILGFMNPLNQYEIKRKITHSSVDNNVDKST